MKLQGYDIFSAFKMFESVLQMDGDTINLIVSISNASSVAKELVRIYDSRKDLKLNQNYLSKADANDEVKFMNDSQGKRIKEEGGNPYDSKTSAKIGRVVRQILVADGLTPVDTEIEKFVNLYKAAWNKKYTKSDERMRLIKGEDIRFWYNQQNYHKGGGTLNNSCMRYDHTQKFLDIYVNNPEVCQLLIYVDSNNDLISRALLWNLDAEFGGSKIFLDRIYYTHDHQQREVYDFAVSKFGQIHSHFEGLKGVPKVKLKKWRFEYYPYMDSLYFLYPNITSSSGGPQERTWGDAILTTEQPRVSAVPAFRIRVTGGLLEQQTNWLYSRRYKTPYLDGEVKWIEEKGIDIQGRSTTVGDYLPKHELAWCDGEEVWVTKDLAEYSELYKKTYRKTSLVDSEWGKIPAGSLVGIYDIVGGSLIHLKSIPKIIMDRKSDSYHEEFVLADHRTGTYFIKKDKCIPPIKESGRYCTKDNLSDSRMLLYNVKGFKLSLGSDTSDIFGVPSEIKSEYLGSRISSIYIPTKFGRYPIGLSIRGASGLGDSNYCEKTIADVFKFEIISDEYWISKKDYYYWVCNKMIHKEVSDINNKIAPVLNKSFNLANGYLLSDSSEYIELQKSYEIESYPGGIEKFVENNYFSKFSTSASHGSYYDLLMSSLPFIKKWFDSNSTGYSLKGKSIRGLSLTDHQSIIDDNIKVITFLLMLNPIVKNDVGAVMNYINQNINFFDQSCGIGIYSKEDINFLRLYLYSEVTNNFAKLFASKIYNNTEGPTISKRIRGNEVIARIFNSLWDRLEPIVEKGKIQMQKEIEKIKDYNNNKQLHKKSPTEFSYSQLLRIGDGLEVDYNIEGSVGVGKLSVHDGRIFICQNDKSGNYCPDRKGFDYSWVLSDGGGSDSYTNRILAIYPQVPQL